MAVSYGGKILITLFPERRKQRCLIFTKTRA